MQRAGVDRPGLYEDTATVKWIALYDLRATGITWRTLRKDDARDIKREAGHKDQKTTDGYVRAATVYRGRVGDPFPRPAGITPRDGEIRSGIAHE